MDPQVVKNNQASKTLNKYSNNSLLSHKTASICLLEELDLLLRNLDYKNINLLKSKKIFKNLKNTTKIF